MTEQTATQTGVETDAEVIGTENPRNAFIAGIADQVPREDGAETETEEPQTETETVEAEKKPDPEEDLVPIKVDGQEQKVSRDKIIEAGIRALQKESTADKRLEEATRLLNEAKQTRATEEVVQPPSLTDAELAQALQSGTPEEAAAVINLLKGRAAIPTEDVTTQIDQRVADRISHTDATKHFLTEYKDIVEDPYLMTLAQQMDERGRSERDGLSYLERYNKIGAELRAWRAKATKSETLQDKRAAKASGVTPQAAQARQAAPNEESEDSPRDVINKMRQSRGQA